MQHAGKLRARGQGPVGGALRGLAPQRTMVHCCTAARAGGGGRFLDDGVERAERFTRSKRDWNGGPVAPTVLMHPHS